MLDENREMAALGRMPQEKLSIIGTFTSGWGYLIIGYAGTLKTFQEMFGLAPAMSHADSAE